MLAALPESAEMVRRPRPGRRRRGAKWGPSWQWEEEWERDLRGCAVLTLVCSRKKRNKRLMMRNFFMAIDIGC